MKNSILFLMLFAATGVFAACPIDGISNACVAQFQNSITPPYTQFQPTPITQPKSTLQQNPQVREFSPTPTSTTINRGDLGEKALRTFGPQDSDFGYNSSCQFGICRNTGTPATFNNQ